MARGNRCCCCCGQRVTYDLGGMDYFLKTKAQKTILPTIYLLPLVLVVHSGVLRALVHIWLEIGLR